MPTSEDRANASANLPLPSGGITGAMPIDSPTVITAVEAPALESESDLPIPDAPTGDESEQGKQPPLETRTLDQIVKDAQAMNPPPPSGPPN